MSALTDSLAWRRLQRHRDQLDAVHMRDLFAADPQRFERYSVELGDVLFDYSKNRIIDDTLPLLIELSAATGLREKIDAMFAGQKINVTEQRSVLHIALRNRANRSIYVDGKDVMPQVNHVLDRMRQFTQQVTNGIWLGFSGKRITDVVNIGIGGSDLGPKTVVRALTPFQDQGIRAHFVSNVDGADLLGVLDHLDPETTLFIIASKTFTTLETMLNARSARSWLLGAAGHEQAVRRHFIALSTNAKHVTEFGIDPELMFEFWDWVGGRYSLWSAIGLPIALTVGMERFEELLSGAHAVDEHFRTTPFARNIPVIMAVLGIWYGNFWGAETHAILPYDQLMEYFPAYLQQADMESNGKRVDVRGETVDYPTGPVIFGQPGTNGQHAFYQLIHQGTRLIPCDFLLAARPYHLLHEHHAALVANCLAQSEALMCGRTYHTARAELTAQGTPGAVLDTLARAKTFPGNRPSNTFFYTQLSPYVLGQLLALYEHKIFVQGVIWNINSFDQMGVELGKQLATHILDELPDDHTVTGHDASTRGLINAYKRRR